MGNMRVLLSLALAGTLVGSAGYAAESLSFQGARVTVPGGQTKMTFRLRGTPLREALQLIAESGNLNLILDESVEGSVSLDFFQTPLNQILETMLHSNGYRLQTYGKSFVVYRSGQYGQPVMRFVPLKFVSAQALLPTLHDLLDIKPPVTEKASGSVSVTSTADVIRDLFALSIKSDPRSSRIVLSGPQDKVDNAEELIRRLDVLTPSRVFPLNFVTVKEAVDFLRATFFDVGAATVSMTIEKSVPDFEVTKPGESVAMRKEQIQVFGASPRFIPMPTQNALLVMGSQSELVLTEQVLKTIDRRRKQVLIRAQIIEMAVGAMDNQGVSYQGGSRQFDLNSTRTDGTFTFDTISNSALNLQVKVNAMVTANRAKVLASPQLLAMDGRSSVISIDDTFIETLRTETVQTAAGQIVNKNAKIGTAGITLELLPRIDANNGVTLNVHPTISVAQAPITDSKGDIIATPVSKREYKSQEVFVRDGQTIVIGGLIQERKVSDVQKIPVLGDLPFLGTLFRTRVESNKQTEVQIFLTPEVVKDGENPRT